VITDISGTTGKAILNAILAGERDRNKLAQLADPRVKATQEEIAKSLEGNWRPELLFVLRQQMETYQVWQKRIQECDEAIQAHLKSIESKAEPGDQPPVPKRGKKAGRNAPEFNLRGELYRITGIDLTSIDGINVMTAQTIVAEVGLDMSKWPTEKHFASWLGLCPDNKITGGKVYHRGTRNVENRAATAFRMAATSLWRSKTYLGAKFKRLRANLGAPKAITAVAHHLARLVYRMLKYGQEYVDKGMEFYQQRYQEQQIKWMQKKAIELGLTLTVTASPTANPVSTATC
jgi:transposase